MSKINDKMDYVDEKEKRNKFGKEIDNQFKYYNLKYNVNFFGVCRGSEDFQ